MALIKPSSATSLAALPNDTAAISEALGAFISSRSATFACGGLLPLEDPCNADGTETNPYCVSIPGVVLRWDSTTEICKLQFPFPSGQDLQFNALEHLLRDCQTASFGRNGENVIDESYRRATKMDRSKFSVDFCPYEMGIIDTITQLLLPNSDGHVSTKGVRAELYKLNVYTAPSGYFKSHVDTPRSSTQFGSLVVSLPCYHQGGQLIVRHAQHSKSFDWSMDATRHLRPAIHWAAFYSDCEHEVMEVTEGHRVTLTYNLYHAQGVGDLAGNSLKLNIPSLPLFQHVQEALRRPEFMPQGGALGIYCQHAYAHTHADGAKALPAVLKGPDMAVYNVFKHLELRICVRAILDTRKNSRSEFLNDYLEIHMENDENYDELPNTEGIHDYQRPFFQTYSVVGDLGGYGASESTSDEHDGMDEIMKEWAKEQRGGFWNIVWVNEPRHSGLDMVHLTYGNEAGIGTLYSHAAMLVKIPPIQERNM